MSQAQPVRRKARVPVLLQASRAECGAACLAMVLAHHGVHLPRHQLQQMCPVGRDGVSAAGIKRAAQQAGMTAKGYAASSAAVGRVALPAIAHWEDNHFVVIERVSPGRVDVVDPRLGRRRLPREEFDAALGKIVLSVQPDAGFVPDRSRQEPFWRRYLRSLISVPGTRRLLAQVLLVTVIAQLLVVAMPLATKIVVDDATALRTSSLVTLLGTGLVVATVAQLVTGLLRSALLVRLQGRLDTHALIGFTAHLLRLPLRYFEQRSTGDIVTRFGTIALLRDLMTGQTLSSLLDATLVLTYLVLLLVIDPVIALAVLAITVAVIALLWITTPLVRERMALDLSTQSEAQGYLVEMLEGIPTLKASAAEDRAMSRLADLLFTWITVTLRRGYLAAAIDAVTTALRFLTPLLVLWLCVTRVLAGTMTPGTMLAVTWLAAAIVTPLASVATNAQRLQLAGAQLQRLADVLEADPEPRPDTPSNPAPPPGQGSSVGPLRLQGRIELRDVAFQYDPYSPPVLRGISASIQPGQRVAIVGSTGSGKTTLGMLLLNLYRPTAGEIAFDGRAAQTLDPRKLRAQFGVVLQEPFAFSGTIRDNIALHDPSLSQQDIVRAARLACLHDDVAATPNGYATHLGHRGVGLSGGQRQRLALARALAHQPAVVLLDEATSHLDAVTEAHIHANLAAQRCTQIIIAHRLSTIRDADQILVLHDGHLVEAGTHHDLLAQRGHYTALVTAQVDDEPNAATNHPSATPAIDREHRPPSDTDSPSLSPRDGDQHTARR